MSSDVQNLAVRWPLIVVDRARDPDDFMSGWLRLVGPAELPFVHVTRAVDVWDADARPVRLSGDQAQVVADYQDGAAREALVAWRSRAPVPLLTGGRSGETAVPFLVDDIVVIRSRLTADGRTRPRPPSQRLLPILLMILTALVLIPLVRIDAWGMGAVAALYGVSAGWMNRWSYPVAEWGNPPRHEPPDTISRMAYGSKVVFWSVAAAAVTLAVLDWAEIVVGFAPWA